LCPISPDFREGGSEQIHEGAQISEKSPTDNVERFLSMLRFDSRAKVSALAVLWIQKRVKSLLSGSNLFSNRKAQWPSKGFLIQMDPAQISFTYALVIPESILLIEWGMDFLISVVLS